MSLDKRERLIHLLRTLRDVRDAQAGTESFGDMAHDRLLLLADDYHRGSYAELERALDVMLTDRTYHGFRLRTLRFHLNGIYACGTHAALLCNAKACQGLSRWERQSCARPDHNGHKKVVRQTIIVRTARDDLARLGLDFLENEFRGEPFLPPALWSMVAPADWESVGA